MLKRLRRLVESIVFAGMEPSGSARNQKRFRWLGPLTEPLERFLAGGPAPDDPLYLTNRSWKQRLKLGLGIGLPCVLLLGALAVATSNLYTPKTGPPRDPTAAEIAANLLPGIEKTVSTVPKDAEITNVRVVKDGDKAHIIGVVHSNADRIISVEFVLDLTDIAGSRIGAVAQRVEHMAPKASEHFDIAAPEGSAAFALVREVRVVD